MTLGVVFRRAARGEFDAAALWYEDRQAAVFFRPEANRVVVLAVFHARRNPAVWQARA